MKKQLSLLLALLMLATQSVAAEKEKKKPVLDKKKFSIGAGISANSVGPFDETGFQFFAAYDLSKVNLMEGVDTSLEFGYMDYGFSQGDDDGLWATAVVDGTISGKLGWLARAGFDFGDDSGLMVGAGLGLDMNEKVALRFEYVIRDDVDSIQLNLVYHM
jgi:hypothetical protein